MSNEENFVTEDEAFKLPVDNFNSYDATNDRFLEAQIKEASENTKRKNDTFSMVTFVVVGMFLAAVIFAFCALDAISDSDGKADWHLLITVTALLIPPTIICIALIRGIYNDSGRNSKNIKLKDLPTSELVTAVKEIAPSVKSFFSK